MPSKMRKRGRPKGVGTIDKTVVIGLPKAKKTKKTSKPIPFIKKQQLEKDRSELKLMCRLHNIII